MSGRRIVVAGGAGFIGSHLCRALLDRGDEVVAVDNLVTGVYDNLAGLAADRSFTFVEHDIVEPFSVDGPVDAVLNFASPASPVDFGRIPISIMRTGSAGTYNTLELAVAAGARYLLASTSEVYGDPLVHPQPESYLGNVNCVGPRAVYDEAKRYAEAMTMAYRRSRGLDVRVVRIFNTYGPRMRPDDGRVVSNFLVQALGGRPLTVQGDGTQTRSFCYVDDEVRGILALLDSDHGAGPVNVGNPDEHSVLELAEAVLAVTGSSSPIEHVPLPVDDPTRRCPDIAVATEALGWKPEVALHDGLSRTAEWFARG